MYKPSRSCKRSGAKLSLNKTLSLSQYVKILSSPSPFTKGESEWLTPPLWGEREGNRFKVVTAAGLTSSHPEQRS